MYCDSMSSPVHNIMGLLHDIFLRRIHSTRRPSSINGRVRVIGVLFWFINLLGNLGFRILRLFCRRATIGHDCPWSLAEDGTFAHDNVVVDCTLKLEFIRIQRVRGLDVVTIIIIDASGMLDLETAYNTKGRVRYKFEQYCQSEEIDLLSRVVYVSYHR